MNSSTKVNMRISKFLFMHSLSGFMHAFFDLSHVHGTEVRALELVVNGLCYKTTLHVQVYGEGQLRDSFNENEDAASDNSMMLT